jgi:hypothetical protein
MKVESGRGVGGASGPKRAGGVAAPGFTLGADAPQKAAAVTGMSGVTALDAILALQGEDGPAHRRARQVRRGHDALDVLAEVERALVLGRGPASLKGLLESLRGKAEATGDPGLDDVLREIDTRLAVEAAKLERV